MSSDDAQEPQHDWEVVADEWDAMLTRLLGNEGHASANESIASEAANGAATIVSSADATYQRAETCVQEGRTEAAIIAIGTIQEIPVVVDGQLAVGKRMSLTMSCDHRVIDGALGAQYLKELANILEKPESLAL